MLITKTVHNTNRLYVMRSELPENNTQFSIILVCLGVFSIWGGHDQNEETYLSWEFSNEFSEETIKTICSRLQIKITEEKPY